jgi:hypothetical protein
VEPHGLLTHGLYYPYFHIRDARWLKAAALYWPKIIRVIPEDYPTVNDTDTMRVLIEELGFVVGGADPGHLHFQRQGVQPVHPPPHPGGRAAGRAAPGRGEDRQGSGLLPRPRPGGGR